MSRAQPTLGVGVPGMEQRGRALLCGYPSCARACAELGRTHKFTHAYRPQTDGKAERFIQSALREWAYG